MQLPTADLPSCQRLAAPAPALMGTALLLSHLLTRALAERPFAASDAPAWFEATARLMRSKLQVCCCGSALLGQSRTGALLPGSSTA